MENYIQNVQIENYKLFDKLKVEDIKPFTLIGGRNNVGKSTLLEAIFMLHDFKNVNLLLKHGWRGIDKMNVQLKDLISLHFYDQNLDSNAKILLENSRIEKIILDLEYIEDYALSSVDLDEASSSNSDTYHTNALKSQLRIDNKDPFVYFFYIDGNKILREPKEIFKVELIPTHIFLPTNLIYNGFVSDFDKLDKDGREKKISEIMRKFEHRIEKFSINLYGKDPYIFVKLKDLKKTHLINFMGSGFVRLAQFVVKILNSPNAIILIDEIENGIHHSIMPKVFEILADAAADANCQVIATTHSYECLQSAHEGLKKHKDDFAYIRLEEIDGSIEPVNIDYDSLGIALESGWEVR